MDGKQIIAFVMGIMASSCTDKGPSNKLQEKLNELKNSTPPDNYTISTCYLVVPLDTKNVYRCPTCGKKTVYDSKNDQLTAIFPISSSETIDIITSIDYYREKVPQQLKELSKEYNLGFSFDESGFCEHCRPSGTPQLVLQVVHPDNRVFSTPIKSRDITLLSAFFNNDKTFYDESGECHNLADEAKRIAELLGLSL